jgi:hypothetical protein
MTENKDLAGCGSTYLLSPHLGGRGRKISLRDIGDSLKNNTKTKNLEEGR